MNCEWDRRNFLVRSVLGIGSVVSGFFLAGCGRSKKAGSPGKRSFWIKTRDANQVLQEIDNHVAVAESSSPAENVKKALDLLGGMQRFVSPGQTVVVKPNIAWNRPPSLGANTDPQVVAAVVEACLKAGAKKVLVFDRTCDDARRTYRSSGIRQAAAKAGADVMYVEDNRFAPISIPKGKLLKSWTFYTDALTADVYINVPCAKCHSQAVLTLGMKNVMGIMGGDRGTVHAGIHQKLADTLSAVKPHLTILDGTRILVKHGPQGGSPRDVKPGNKVIAGANPLCVDAFATRLFDMKPSDIGYIVKAHEMGLGEIDEGKMKILG